jgi:hypothetical protein
MRSGAHSSVGTILLLIPILAVPMLAIFGVPQFTPAVASPLMAQREQQKNLDDAPSFSRNNQATDPLVELAEGTATELPAWADERDAAAATLAQRRRNERVATSAAVEASVTSPFSAAGSEPAPRQGRPIARTVAPKTAATEFSGLTWKTAVQRLNELEIRNFRLEPGHQAQQFAFYCSFTPPETPRVSYRFEAEADEPLRAVEKVLQQIETWRAAR